VSTDDIFDDSKWSNAVYFEEVGFDQDVSDPHIDHALADSSSYSMTMVKSTRP
jgi:hypothetical protein